MTNNNEQDDFFEAILKQFFSQMRNQQNTTHSWGYRTVIGPDGVPHTETWGNPPMLNQTPQNEKETPYHEVREEKDKTIITIDLPGVEKKDIIIRKEDDNLIFETPNASRKFYKEIHAPDVDVKKAKATYRNGVLDVVFKRKVEKKKQVETIPVE